MPPIVEIKNIGVTFHDNAGETNAIENLSFQIHEGDFIAVVGPSGCGKSTMLEIISGLLKPNKGEVLIHGAPPKKGSAHIGYMLQKDHLFEWRSILKNTLLGLEVQGKLTDENIQYVHRLLEMYGLGDFKYHLPSQLSGGMRQRAALIRTLAIKPDILLLDEPFSALDYQTRLQVSDEIGAIIQKEKKTAILVTHDISEAISLASRVLVFSKRPATLKSVYDIRLSIPDRTPMKSREAPEFREYFNAIWKELDVHEL